ncbi:MAG: hypothetical protein QW727_00170 [Candidatus Pacearchaeota archaeon]
MIKNRMEFRGYMNLSQYARDCLMSEDLLTIKLLKEIKEMIGDRDAKTKKV